MKLHDKFRPQLALLSSRLADPRRFLQILAGHRQVSNTTTLARQAIERIDGQSHYASTDLPAAPDARWIKP
ncbi:MAG: hypothetical protein JNM42_15855 [Propionivibrio sp.]|uniref:hypothetical protein n=1 Tax=Propionivibrio sp. TaxID=2212460 RepID=UPI001A5EE4A0|nr:hypothetical protein [Propionivibrio sp.]MBL8415906.1 hypothetical protein [Propionivibrio sp.]